MTVTTRYRVEVEIPDNVVAWLNEHQTYLDRWHDFWDPVVYQAINGCISSGNDDHGTPFEWAEFDSELAARECESALLEGIAELQALIPA